MSIFSIFSSMGSLSRRGAIDLCYLHRAHYLCDEQDMSPPLPLVFAVGWMEACATRARDRMRSSSLSRGLPSARESVCILRRNGFFVLKSPHLITGDF